VIQPERADRSTACGGREVALFLFVKSVEAMRWHPAEAPAALRPAAFPANPWPVRWAHCPVRIFYNFFLEAV
jgi:hypothetical protein